MYTQFLSSAPLFQYQYDIVTTSKYFLLLTALHVYTYFSTGVLEKKEEENIIIFCNKQIFHTFCQNTTQVQTVHHGIIKTQNSGLLTLLTGLLVWCCLTDTHNSHTNTRACTVMLVSSDTRIAVDLCSPCGQQYACQLPISSCELKLCKLV